MSYDDSLLSCEFYLPNYFYSFKQKSVSIKPSNILIRRTGEFISNVVQEAALAKPSSYSFDSFKITCQGEVQNLDESSIEHILNWDKVGVYPGV